ncbi:DUF3613 domain-containing protein [Stenotrophomonas lactitubi]|uniref:DUF3613 domain-containing protein n=1 Tax=Stenotrophomonas lactitubi TaxID=2045214 RepID=UPI001DA8832D|nr:DUF3613 domain-containing protein [Stenotrophomonas lactitubi]CAH0134211.1 hypothetical protein SRABI66_00296 [Stenotrophomonas lactitubi]CAH0184586.1 hypothetical protein SRABI122_01509 [Stenotrophomonas lactitubi]CAH0199337.1 hypothetical protein SRABI102_01730 [Stenotrophomonas lactitubi]CAH0204762.1 hypothetical protein SRABI81_02037 [Stenotrophomonas lactitubi]
MTSMPLIRCLLPMLAGLSFAAVVHAQTPQQPLTGQMLGGATPAPAAAPLHSEPLATVDVSPLPAAPPIAAPAAPQAAPDFGGTQLQPNTSQIGDTTRSLFRLQASGEVAGARLPILGDQATSSYARYLKSFQYDIPQFFETDVAKSAGSSRSGR